MPNQHPAQIAVTHTDSQCQLAAEALAHQLDLPFINDYAAATQQYSFLLVFTRDYLGLLDTSYQKSTPFFIDFSGGKLHHRGKIAGRRNELLGRAIGYKPSDNPYIIDATAGLGRDSFILASIGFQVTMLEKSPIIHALLTDALRRAALSPTLAPVIQRMTLIRADATEWLPLHTVTKKPDVIYLDPMFPARQKSALVKKEMVILQHLLPHDEDNTPLFQQALACTAKRVVVKRPRLAINIADKTPTYCVTGNSSRFDVYVV